MRALAVAAVVAYHGGLGWARGGFLGVDVFFVLSGYLITALLLAEWRGHGAISLRAFWVRRAKRLLPALFLLLLAVAAYARLTAPPDALGRLRQDALSALAYVANWHFILSGRSYFAHAAAPSLLGHTWSLAVEEQFYLVWPVVVALVLRLVRRRHARGLAAVAGAGALASGAAMAVLFRVGHDPSRVYYGTDTHAQSVLVGAALAAAIAAWPRWGSAGPRVWSALGWSGVAVTAWACVAVPAGSSFLYRGGFLAVDLAVALLVASLVMKGTGALAGALSLAPLRYLGSISYGVYLWHWPVFLVANHTRTGLGGVPLLLVRVLATVAVAACSYHLVEGPIRRHTLRPRLGRALAPAAVAVTSLAILVASTPVVEAAATRAGPPLAAPAPARATRVLVEGDSVALTLGQGLAEAASAYGVTVTNRGTLGCGVARDGPQRDKGDVTQPPAACAAWPAAWAADVARSSPDVGLVLVGRWEVMDRVFQGRWTHVGDPQFDAYLLGELRLAADVLSASGAHVTFLTMPCLGEDEQPDGAPWPQDDPGRIGRLNQLVGQAAALSGGRADVFDLAGALCPQGRFAATIDGVQVRNSDGVHVTRAAGPWLAPALLPLLTRWEGAGGP